MGRIFHSIGEWENFLHTVIAKAVTADDNRKAIDAACEVMDNGMRLRTLVDTGATQRSITHNVLTATPDEATAEAGPGTYYAVYQEFGTRKWAGKPFMRMTIGADSNNAMKAAQAVWWDAIVRACS